jgi:3-oxoadipate enol-lactonase
MASGIKLYRTGAGTPLVLLHCLGVDHELWSIAAPSLADDHELIAYDFPGHGAEPLAAKPYGIEDLSHALAALLAEEALPRVHLAGISLGGLVAQHFAATYPDKVGKLLLIDTTPCYVDQMRTLWHERAATARSKGVASMSEHLLEVWFTPDFVAANGRAVSYVRGCFAAANGEGYAQACEALAAADLRPLLPAVTAPTLIVCGRQDLPSFIDAAEEMRAAIKGAELLWLAPARHAAILEQPVAFQEAARAFLAG